MTVLSFLRIPNARGPFSSGPHRRVSRRLSPFWAVQTQSALTAAVTNPQTTVQAACARGTARESASANTGAIIKASA